MRRFSRAFFSSAISTRHTSRFFSRNPLFQGGIATQSCTLSTRLLPADPGKVIPPEVTDISNKEADDMASRLEAILFEAETSNRKFSAY